MPKKIFGILFICIFTIISYGVKPSYAQEQPPKEAEYVPNQALVRLTDEAEKIIQNSTQQANTPKESPGFFQRIINAFLSLFTSNNQQQNALLNTYQTLENTFGITDIKSLEREKMFPTQIKKTIKLEGFDPSKLTEIPSEDPLKNVYLISFTKGTVKEVIDYLINNKLATEGQPNYIYHTSSIPNDPQYPNQWGHKQIQLEEAWDITTGKDVVVAVIDSGVDYNHEDLKDNIWEGTVNGKKVKGWDFADNDSDPMDTTGVGHGTMVAGIIGAICNNLKGICGVNWKIKIMPIRIPIGEGQQTAENQLLAMRFAADNGAKVINISSGGDSPVCETSTTEINNDIYKNSIHNRVITYVVKDKKALMVVASGNSRENSACTYPANHPYVLTVSGTNHEDKPKNNSNYGPLLWKEEKIIAAPGANQGCIDPNCILTTKLGGGYTTTSGTSFSAPYVAGVAALVLSQKDMGPSELKKWLIYTADEIEGSDFEVNQANPAIANDDKKRTYGKRINAFKALSLLNQNISPTQTASPSATLTTNPTITSTPTIIPSITATISITTTPSPTADLTLSPAPSISITNTPTPSLAITPTTQPTPTPTPTLAPTPTNEPSSTPTSTLQPSPTITPLAGSLTQQVDWVYEGQGRCWSAWSGNSCTLKPHEGGAVSISARDFNKDGLEDITCSQSQGENHTSTITNVSDQNITIVCQRYVCNSCTSGNGTNAQCDGSIDKNATKISEEVVLKPSCSLSCTINGVEGNCDISPTPTATPTSRPTTQPTVTPTSLPTVTTALSQTPSPTITSAPNQTQTLIANVSEDNIISIIKNLVDDDETAEVDETQTRYTGTSGNITEADYIKNYLISLGIGVEEQVFAAVESSASTAYNCPEDPSKNIIGRILGQNQNEYYVLTAHLDSTSSNSGLTDPAPGADDNASGVAAVLEAARLLKESSQNLKYSVEFVLFNAEEQGLCGSSYYTQNIPQNKTIKAVFNLDQIGYYNDQAACVNFGYKAYNGGNTLSDKAIQINTNYNIGLQTSSTSTSRPDSDHFSFWSKGISAAFAYECNPATRHTVDDTTDKLNFDQITKITKVVVGTIFDLASDNEQNTVSTPTLTLSVSITPSATSTPTQVVPSPSATPTQILFPTATPTKTPTPTPTTTGGQNQTDFTPSENTIFNLINEFRQQNGAGPLAKEVALRNAARNHSLDLSQHNICGHTGSNGSNMVQRMKAAGYTGYLFGETVACGYSTPEKAFDVWKNSTKGHREIMLKKNLTKVGVGVIMDTYTADFGN